MNYSRKSFLKTLGGITGGMVVAPTLWSQPFDARIKHSSKLNVGLATYTLREYNLDQVLEISTRLQIKDLCLKDFHLPMDSSAQQIKEVVAKVNAAGQNLYGGGVIYMKSAAEVETAFQYAKSAGMKVIVGVPNHDLLELVEKKVKETDIKLAIHNHGPGDDVYPTPESAYEKVKPFDQRMGLCIDIGHVVRLGLDPVKSIKKFSDRLYDLHIKDVDAAKAEGKAIEFGRGVIDLPSVMTALDEINYSGVMGIEYEKDGEDAFPGLAESIGYLRGILATLGI